MNVTFHTLGALATAAVLSSREKVGAGELCAGFAAGVLIHGVLDVLPHHYPIRSSVDVFLALALVLLALRLARPRARALIAVCFAGCITPDVLDLGPAVVNTRLGWSLPVVKFFPWHWPQYSGSIYDGRHAAFSAVSHVAVVTIACTVLFVYRRYLFRGTEVLP